MQRVKITKKDGYRCAPTGAIVETFAYGSVVEGQVAQWALADRAGLAILEKKKKPGRKKVLGPKENK